jgi:luciferase family oxidoreductase group 1
MRNGSGACSLAAMLKLSVLDQSPVRQGVTPRDALFETIELARHVDALGYSRYWLAEHHSSPGLAGSAPEIMVARVASETSHIRIGSGGVMLSHYSALKVAEQFRMLEALYPRRIDLGIGRAPGSDQLTAIALQHGPGALGIEHFPNQISDLLGFLDNRLPADHPFARIRAMPMGETSPEVWLLGSSDQSAIFAAYFGCAFSFAHFINDEGGPEIMDAYRQRFQSTERLANPQGSIGVFVVCADTEAEARRLAASRDLWRLRQRQGILAPFPPPEDALAYPYNPAELRLVEYHRQRQIVGGPEQVKQQLLALAEAYAVDEVVVLTICHDFAARKRSYALLAGAFGLERPG